MFIGPIGTSPLRELRVKLSKNWNRNYFSVAIYSFSCHCLRSIEIIIQTCHWSYNNGIDQRGRPFGRSDKALASALGSGKVIVTQNVYFFMIRRGSGKMHWVAFAALVPNQYIFVALGGNPERLTRSPLIPGTLTFVLTNTWHAGDGHTGEQTALKLFIDCDGQPADHNRQRFWDLHSNMMTPAMRSEVLRVCGPVEQFTVSLC